jgi:hypothetical protein
MATTKVTPKVTSKTDPTDIGLNRTGSKNSPANSKKLIEGAAAAVPKASIAATAFRQVRIEQSNTSEPVGTVPPPASLKGAAKTLAKTLKGERLSVLLDLVGERLAFERSGVRLYDGLLAKFAAASEHPGGPTLEELTLIRDQELGHFHLLIAACEELGGDPTAMTPSADIVGNASSGLLKVVSDPHTTFNQALKAVLIAELADNDGWALLADVATELDLDELATQFEAASAVEEGHLLNVRTWLERSVAGEAGIELDDESLRAPVPA